MNKKPYPETPILEKIRSIKDRSQAIGEFLAWLQQKGLVICDYRKAGDNGAPEFIWKPGVKIRKVNGVSVEGEPDHVDYCNDDAIKNPSFCCWPEGYVPKMKNIEQQLAEYFEIDLSEADKERRQILEWVREENEK